MRKICQIVFLLLFAFAGNSVKADGWIRINQLGYLPHQPKVAVFISTSKVKGKQFTLKSAITNNTVFSGTTSVEDGSIWGLAAALRLDFSSYNKNGSYYLEFEGIKSPVFPISDNVYNGTTDFLLKYMRQQRCGYNPWLGDSCHIHDGIIVDHPTRSGEYIDVHGGWHDATDYLQYTNTSANAVFQLLFAYLKNPLAFSDNYDARGHKGKNGRADVLDEAIWGLEWLMRMNPAPGEMYNQIADDRDHAGFRLPTNDKVTYDLEKGRPVYYVTGERQGIGPHLNRTTGVASTAGKFASAFALASYVLKHDNPDWSALMLQKAKEAAAFGEARPGNTQTACFVSPYFYEEDNYVDDMQLGYAALALADTSSSDKWLKMADYWGELEPVSPWILKHSARHYQYYPFINVGHYLTAASGNETLRQKYLGFMRAGLEMLKKQASEDPFRIGIPFIWCSNNLVAAAISQARLYHSESGDDRYLEMEAALRDWLFGCNPWGTSMICGLPEHGVSPQRPHSSYTVVLNENTYGGLVDGPVYHHIFNSLKGINVKDKDRYLPFQNGKAVYHDDIGDYSTNEPTMDGTASLIYYLSALESSKNNDNKMIEGGIKRFSEKDKSVYLVFPADTHFEGITHTLDVLKKHQVKASFFLTGNCLRQKSNKQSIFRLIKDGHYLGPHSDNHLLYADWIKRDSLLIDKITFDNDLTNNLKSIGTFGVSISNVQWFLPPYEWYNQQISDWSQLFGMQIISFTPGIGTNADYTTPDMKKYRTSKEIINNLWTYEQKHPNGLNGTIILIHPGVSPQRTDKLYLHLDDIISQLRQKGYNLNRL